ncbi:MAG: 1,4-dihydroxy-6-naphthoate synthase [Bacteroidales bacterium]
MNKNLTIGFSTCPNDTFIFDALVHQKINTSGYSFGVVMADVQELNRMALQGDIDIVKVSYAHLPSLAGDYIALTAGGAMGFDCGPLLIAADLSAASRLEDARVAIPGENTTAHFLLKRYFPQISDKTTMLFSEIEDAVMKGTVDAGLIIHESRFTYAAKGLASIADLGELWHQETGLPIPLGAIAVKNSLDHSIRMEINTMVKESVEFALASPHEAMPFVKHHAVEMDEAVMLQHINLYVNQYSVDPGPDGRKAVALLLGGSWPDGLQLYVDQLK